MIEFAERTADDPHAELYQRFAEEGLNIEQIRGVWVVDGPFHNLRLPAARVATLTGSEYAALARNKSRASLILRQSNSLILPESSYSRWRFYRLTPVSTPLSMLGGDELSRARHIQALEPVPDQVADIANYLGADLDWLLDVLQ